MNGINRSSNYKLDGNPDYAGQRVWSFLFGGSGDGTPPFLLFIVTLWKMAYLARHAFGTMIHLSDIIGKRKTLRHNKPHEVRLTLMDIHPASLARVIVVMSLIRQIQEVRPSNDTARSTELFTTLFYVYAAYIMPDYCRKMYVPLPFVGIPFRN